jgi:hypothetical protein
MVYTYYGGIQKEKRSKIPTLIGVVAALLLAVSLFAFQRAFAAPGIVYTQKSFNDLSLVTDRTAPSGGYTITPNDTLKLKIDNTLASAADGFYRTEGLQGTIPASQAIRAKLFVDKAWHGKQIRAGLWGITKDAANDTAWPIIEYTTVGDNSFTGWRVFDTMNGGWTNLTGVKAKAGHWYKLEIAFNSTTKSYDYYVDSDKVYSLTAVDPTSPTDVYSSFTGVIFNNKNFATANHTDDYTVQWKKFAYGTAFDCSRNGWKNLSDDNGQRFRNQGQCVSHANHHHENDNDEHDDD